jgi:Lrp/AsnC family leucine-responsive transcriptional regulator
MKFDRLDRRILELLQRDGSMSNLELAEQVGLSPTPCSRRVKQLENAGIISRKVTLLDPAKLGLDLIAYTQISMDRHTPECVQNFQDRIADFPEVLECNVVAGQAADYLLKVIAPDIDAYQRFLFEKLTRIEGVTGVHSSFVLDKVVERTELPLDYLFEQ